MSDQSTPSESSQQEVFFPDLFEPDFVRHPTDEKVCLKCKKLKKHAEFGKVFHRGKKRIDPWCKECKFENLKKWRLKPGTAKKRRDMRRKSVLEKTYGLSFSDFEKMVYEQNAKCAICGHDGPPRVRKGRLHVDHCHNTGQIRGLLCNECNVALGGFNDDVATLKSAIAYLEKHSLVENPRIAPDYLRKQEKLADAQRGK